MTTIMVATDGSSGACRAIDVAVELAKTLACDLLIVTNHLLGEEVRQLPHTGVTAGDLPEALTGQTLRAAEAPFVRRFLDFDPSEDKFAILHAALMQAVDDPEPSQKWLTSRDRCRS